MSGNPVEAARGAARLGVAVLTGIDNNYTDQELATVVAAAEPIELASCVLFLAEALYSELEASAKAMGLSAADLIGRRRTAIDRWQLP